METLSLYYTDKYISRIASPTAHYRFCPRLSQRSPVLQIADALISTLALYQIYRRLKNQFYFKKAIIAVDRYLQVEEEICAGLGYLPGGHLPPPKFGHLPPPNSDISHPPKKAICQEDNCHPQFFSSLFLAHFSWLF